VDSHKADYAKGTARQQSSLRGMGYLSQFVRDFVYDESFLNYVSSLANEPLCPHSFGMHIVQSNVGFVAAEATEVDVWHFDSVDYVLVIMISDLTDMVGGELEVLRLNLGGKENTLKLKETGIPREHVDTVSY
jgi:hypothetical protein